MTREELEHALRAASAVTGEQVILVIGSQSALGSYDEHQLPAAATRSREVDLGFFNDPGGRKADQLEGAIGEESEFDQTHGFYIDGVDLSTATLPDGWWDRLVDVRTPNTGGATGRCLELHDCVISKLVAGREKDLQFAAALLDHRLIHVDVLAERLAVTDVHAAVRTRIESWLTI